MATKIKKFHKDSNMGDIVVDGKFLHGWQAWESAGFKVKSLGSSPNTGGGTLWELSHRPGFAFSTYGGRTSPGEYRDFIFEEEL
jgi:hypothetical protein